ncbi:TPA: hypothetical protein ACIRHK_001990, partial [Streptococcus suis]
VTCLINAIKALDSSGVSSSTGEIVNQDRIYNITLKVKTDGVYNDLGGGMLFRKIMYCQELVVQK